MYLKTVLIDLDGVLNNYKKYEENYIPEIKEGALEFLEKLYKSGRYELILFKAREPELAEKWLEKEKIAKFFKKLTNIKIPAYLYIDDMALKFNGNFDETFEEIEKFQIYWKK